MIERVSQWDESKMLHSLARVIARRCRGGTLVLGRPFPELMARLESRPGEAQALRIDVPAIETDPADPTPGSFGIDGSFDTVLLVRAVEYQDRQESLELVRLAWRALAPCGQLLVLVPNEDHVADPDLKQRFTRRSLKELLKTVDQPRVFTDQPFAWLFMCVDSDPRVNRVTHDRHQVIAQLCRGRVLELGCAAGHLCAAVAERGLTVTGVDKNTSKVAKARRLFPDITFTQADILKLPVERRYDTVLLAEVIEHVPEDVGARMLETAWELVAPGGRLVVSVPNEDCVRHANHLQEFTLGDLAELLRPFGGPVTVTDQPFKWLLMYVDRDA